MQNKKILKVIEKNKLFSNLPSNERWLLNAISCANITRPQLLEISNLKYKVNFEEGAFWSPADSSINIGIKSHKNLYKKNGNTFNWKNLNNEFKKEIIHKVCHEISHFYASKNKSNFINYFLKRNDKNYPHHKTFYKYFKKICPKKYQYIEYDYYPNYAKLGRVPLENNSWINKMSAIGSIIYYLISFLIGLIIQRSFF